jgi:hypothetical protein
VTWEQTVRDVLVILAVGVASGKAGWWAHATREERRMRRMVGRAEQVFDIGEPLARHPDGSLNTDPVCICGTRLAEFHPCAAHLRV